jgi:hypothetical protein
MLTGARLGYARVDGDGRDWATQTIRQETAMTYRYFKATSGGGTMTSIYRCPANGKGVFEQSPADVEEYRSDGTWAGSQREKLWKEASSGWFAESDDEISADRAVQLMSKISEAARQSGAAQTQSAQPKDPPKNTQLANKPIGGNQGAGSRQPDTTKAVGPEKKSRPRRRKITVGAIIFVGAWIVLIYSAFHNREDKPIIHPLNPDGMRSSISVLSSLVVDSDVEASKRLRPIGTG